MRRGLLILLALLAATWFEFQVYPGHTFLNGETQLLVPMLERMDSPGFLSRDLVASHPVFAYTLYDEITQLLHAALHLTFEQALLRQQMVFRFAALLGVFLFSRAMRVGPGSSVLLSVLVNAITYLSAPAVFATSPEPTPAAFAFSLVLLASGLLISRSVLLAGLAAGVALLYDPVTASAFWFVILVISLADRSFRKMLRPAWLSLLIFALILGNFSQLQAGIGGGQELTSQLSDGMIHLTQIRMPSIWISNWVKREVWSYLFVLVAGAWALARSWDHIDRLSRWIVIGLALSGPVSAGAALLLLASRLQIATGMPLAGNLIFSVSIAFLISGVAFWNSLKNGRWTERICWAAFLAAILLNAQVLDLFHLKLGIAGRQQALTPDLSELAGWAEQNTWGSSMFQFADVGKALQPGAFRALSRRSLWADWQSGQIAGYSGPAGQEWWARWQANSPETYSPQRLQAMLPLPIDYYVLHCKHQMNGIKPAFSNKTYVVYDAHDLRQVQGPLQQARRLN